jgi:adenylylsulfate kinase-like enzyme
MRQLLEAMQRAQQGSANEIGIWVSGFYGSGKSSFSKYLGFALDEERKINGEPFKKLLVQRLNDEATKSLLNTVSS